MGDPASGEQRVFLALLGAGANLELEVQGAFSSRSGATGLARCLWAERKPESGGTEAAPGPAASAHVPLAAGTRLRYPVRRARGSGVRVLPPPSREALAPPFLKSLILTVAKALRNTAHCWQLPGGLTELRGQRRGNKRERLRFCPSGCCKTSVPTSRQRERPAHREGPLYVLLSRSRTRRSRPRSSEQKSQRRKVSAAGEAGWGACQPSPPRAGFARRKSVRRSWGITTGCATTG